MYTSHHDSGAEVVKRKGYLSQYFPQVEPKTFSFVGMDFI